MKSHQLLVIGEKIENARANLQAAKNSTVSAPVSVTDSLAMAIVQIDKSLDALDREVGKASRMEYRNLERAAIEE